MTATASQIAWVTSIEVGPMVQRLVTHWPISVGQWMEVESLRNRVQMALHRIDCIPDRDHLNTDYEDLKEVLQALNLAMRFTHSGDYYLQTAVHCLQCITNRGGAA